MVTLDNEFVARLKVGTEHIDTRRGYTHMQWEAYFTLYEEGHGALLETAGVGFDTLLSSYGLRTFVRTVNNANFYSQLFAGDDIEVATRVSSIGTTSLTYESEIRKVAPGKDSVVAASANITVVFVDGDGKSANIPDAVITNLKPYMEVAA